jgi:hypothetical protein
MNDAPLAGTMNVMNVMNAGELRSPLSYQIKVYRLHAPGTPENSFGSQTVKE